MNKFTSSFLALAVLSSSAQAADLYLDPPVIANYAEPDYDWSGFYAGVFSGFGAGAAFADSVPTGAPVTVSVSGWLAGLDLGYNWQMDGIVLGIEGDAALSSLSGSTACSNPAFTCSGSAGWIATLRGRAGLAVDQALFYATAGIGTVGATSTVSPTAGFSGTFSGTHIGYVLGAGIELAATEDFSVKAEYNYLGLNTVTAPAGTLNTVPTTISPSLHTIKIGANFHF